MHLTRRKMTARWLIVVVAIVALAFPLYRMARFHQEYSQASLIHGESEKYYGLQLKNLALSEFAASVSPERRRELMDGWTSRARDRANYHAEMKRKYERAASRPWDPLEPDPPEPE
jgi:hypothetical protein